MWVKLSGQGQTFSDFDTGGKLTEIGLAGVVGLRAGKSLDWDGEKMEAKRPRSCPLRTHRMPDEMADVIRRQKHCVLRRPALFGVRWLGTALDFKLAE